jgi:FixJ family two-component response regulator
MTPANPLVYLIDDDEAFRESLRWMLRAAGYRVASYAMAEHFLAAHEPGAGACIVLDLRMPGMSGLELQEELLRRRELMPIIFVTGHGDVPMAVRAVKRGAFDFVEKPFDGRTLIGLIKRALRQDSRQLVAAAGHVAMVERMETLSPREHEVMRLVLEGKTNKMIGAELGISVKTVECHRARMMDKLQASSVAELVRLVMAGAQHATEL